MELNVISHHCGDQDDGAENSYWHLTLPNTDYSKPGTARESNFLLGLLDILNSFLAKVCISLFSMLMSAQGYHIHSTSSPGDIIVSKKPEGINRVFINEFLSMEQSSTHRIR